MHLDLTLTVAGALVGLLVGLTGMGGGALLTPILVLIFGVPPLAAISSDLVTSVVMKPVGALVHLRRRSVQHGLLGWLALGSVPAAFTGAVLIGRIGRAASVQHLLKLVLGVALLLSVAATVLRAVRDRRAQRAARVLVVRPLRTVLIGAVGGVAVGLTSVGAGSLVIALLLLAYPGLTPRQLVGTDIVQAIPLVAAAAAGHLLFGEVRLAVTGSLLLGALPAVYLGARLSAQAPAAVTRPIITAVLLVSGLALLAVPVGALVAAALAGGLAMVALGRSTAEPAALVTGEGATAEPAAVVTGEGTITARVRAQPIRPSST
ncbi:MAG TPA: sulfite exporter TauE/SafE family protein [Jatrophihabitans sp.]|nr:sulfite exporter TauE/SafE family protein [Jatrophihabitans sp.]